MNCCTVWFLLLAFCEKSITRKLPFSQNWYMTPLLWPGDPSIPRLAAWSPINTRYGRYIQNNMMTSALNPIYQENHRPLQNNLKTALLRNTIMQINNQANGNQTHPQVTERVNGFQPSYLQQITSLQAVNPTTPATTTNSFYPVKDYTQTTTSSHSFKYCRRNPALYKQRSQKLELSQVTAQPTTAQKSAEETHIFENKYKSSKGKIKENQRFKQQSFFDDNSHSFFTLNDAVTPSFENFKSLEKDHQTNLKFFSPTIIPTVGSESKPVEYSETLESSDSNTSTQRLLPTAIETSLPVAYTTEYLESLTTESLLAAHITTFTTEPTTTTQPILTTLKQPDLNLKHNATETNKRYIRKPNKSSARLTLQKHRLSPRLKLKSKQEFFKQVRSGKLPSTVSSQLETQTFATDHAEITTNTILNEPTSTKPTKLGIKRTRFIKSSTSTIATRLENYIVPSKTTERSALKQRSLKRFVKKSNDKQQTNKSDTKAQPLKSTAASPTLSSQKRNEPTLKLERSPVIKSTQSTIMKIYGNKNHVESTKFANNLLESRRHPKETSDRTKVQPLPIEIFFKNQQVSVF